MAPSTGPEEPSCLEATVSFPDLLGFLALPPEDCVFLGQAGGRPAFGKEERTFAATLGLTTGG